MKTLLTILLVMGSQFSIAKTKAKIIALEYGEDKVTISLNSYDRAVVEENDTVVSLRDFRDGYIGDWPAEDLEPKYSPACYYGKRKDVKALFQALVDEVADGGMYSSGIFYATLRSFKIDRSKTVHLKVALFSDNDSAKADGVEEYTFPLCTKKQLK